MKRRPFARFAAVALTAAVAVLPSAARAVPILSQYVECRGVAEVGAGETVCFQPFNLAASRTPSQLETHGNFHARSSSGSVIMEWYDLDEGHVGTWTCQAPGMYLIVDLPGGFALQGGPADLSDSNCRREGGDGEAATVSGPQMLIVRASVDQCQANDGSRTKCPYHGYLSLNRSPTP